MLYVTFNKNIRHLFFSVQYINFVQVRIHHKYASIFTSHPFLWYEVFLINKTEFFPNTWSNLRKDSSPKRTLKLSVLKPFIYLQVFTLITPVTINSQSFAWSGCLNLPFVASIIINKPFSLSLFCSFFSRCYISEAILSYFYLI